MLFFNWEFFTAYSLQRAAMTLCCLQYNVKMFQKNFFLTKFEILTQNIRTVTVTRITV